MKAVWFLAIALGTTFPLGCEQGVQDGPEGERTVRAPMSVPIAQSPAAPAQLPHKREDLPKPITLTAEDWPQYRGERRDGISQATKLTRSWPAGGPRILWETSVGQGYAAPSVVAGKVYLNDYDETRGEWIVRCLALDTGRPLWRYAVKKRIRPNHGITRTAPATDGGFVVAIDPKCEIHCLDARNGELIWKKFLPVEYGSRIPPWYNGQCPLIDGNRLVIATGGRVLMTALKLESGEAIWETENNGQFALSHSSITPVEIEGTKQYTYTTLKGAVGVDAETGRLLWHFPWKLNTAVTTTPLPLGNGQLLLTAGYHAQTVIFQVKHLGDNWAAREVLSLPPPTSGWNSEVQTPILYRNRIYGVGKKQRGLWTCLDLSGNELWTSAHQASFELGGYLLADGMFFVLEGKTGTLRVLDANADHYQEIASLHVLEGPDVWAPPVISRGRLLIRDLSKLVCLDIASDGSHIAASPQGKGSSIGR
jgi:outer membrane protein assembly factor BamB